MLLVVVTNFLDKDEDLIERKPFDFIEKTDEERIKILVDGGYCKEVPMIKTQPPKETEKKK